jgi:hypothetical protein
LVQPRPGEEIVLRGTVAGSEEAFAAETFSPAQERFPCVRNSIGPSLNRRNNAVYDRRWDWVLIGPGDGQTRIKPLAANHVLGTFSWENRGKAITLIFRPRFYQRHKNLKYFEPWSYRIWPSSVTGWCSWWAYQEKFNQKDLDQIVETLAAHNLPEFGYRYVQIDDCYERGRGDASVWLRWNEKFPGGPAYAARKIRSGGMDPAIWVGVNNNDERSVREHPDWFVRDALGHPFRAPWIEYGLDATNAEAMEKVVLPTYRGFRDLGYRYVKVDALRHLLYDCYHNRPDYLAKRHSSPADAFRRFLGGIRKELGDDAYLLACWGVLPEAIGIADGCRLGTDGFGPATLQQYNSWNNVVWRNDPDHCDILPGGRKDGPVTIGGTTAFRRVPGETLQRPCLASLAGAMLMLSDRPSVYADADNLEGVKRSGPILFTRPGQLYDFDPRKSDNVIRVERTLVKAGGPSSPIDAEQWGKVCPWWLLEIDRPFDHWMVVAHFNWESSPLGSVRVNFADLGLAADRDYLVYEFWSKKFLGASKGSFVTAPVEPKGLQIYAVRRALDRPQIVSTNRHISQGAVDLLDIRWDKATATLSGRSHVVRNDPYELAIRVPAGYTPVAAQIAGTNAALRLDGELVGIHYSPTTMGEIDWQVNFKRRVGSVETKQTDEL